MRKALLLSLVGSTLVGSGSAGAQVQKPGGTSAATVSAPKAPSSQELLKAAIAVFKDSIDRKQGLLVPGNTLFIDRDDLDVRLRALGFDIDYPKGNPSYGKRAFTVRSWNAIKNCRGTGAVENCTLPPHIVVVRFFNARWTVENSELMLVIGAFRRAETDVNNPSLGGSVATLVFERRGNQWVLTKVAKVANS